MIIKNKVKYQSYKLLLFLFNIKINHIIILNNYYIF